MYKCPVCGKTHESLSDLYFDVKHHSEEEAKAIAKAKAEEALAKQAAAEKKIDDLEAEFNAVLPKLISAVKEYYSEFGKSYGTIVSIKEEDDCFPNFKTLSNHNILFDLMV